MNILVGVSGGIACYKVVSLVSMLKREGHDVRVVMTETAAELVSPHTFQTVSGNPVALSLFGDDTPHEVKHISWATWAQAVVLAPATANTLGKLAAGIADNMLTTMLMAVSCPILAVPAMNSVMLASAAVQSNLTLLRQRGVYVMEPAQGRLACGISGPGRMPEPEQIADFVRETLCTNASLRGRRILVTAGPTQEPIDPVRSITNRSSGKMGYSIAAAAQALGAEVTLVSGPVALSKPFGCSVVQVKTAQEMYDAVMGRAKNQDIIICAAAVSDYRPVHCEEHKIKKTSEELVLRLERTPDILAALGENKAYFLVGFAAETENLEANATQKLRRKHLDMIVANDVSCAGIGFDAEDNAVTLIKADGSSLTISQRPKMDVARRILAEIDAALCTFDH